jgi:hypothetical protein
MHLDPSQAAEALAGPHDTRQWCSYGTVCPDTPGARSVTFTTAYGPLVNVKLHPSGLPVVCRVAHEVAGNGEADWTPFVAGDEVIVLIPEGDEKAGCVIAGRLNQEIDAFPPQVAGMDPTQNNFAFRRVRTPYVFELGAGYLLRNATTKAFFSMDATGAFTLSTPDNAFLALNADFLGLQNGPGDALIQIGLEAKQVLLQAQKTMLTLDGSSSSLYTPGTLQIGTAGNQAAWHATSVEAMVNFLAAIVTGLGPLFTVPLTPTEVQALVEAAIVVASGTSVAPYASAISTALAIPAAPGTNPGLGAPGLLVG